MVFSHADHHPVRSSCTIPQRRLWGVKAPRGKARTAPHQQSQSQHLLSRSKPVVTVGALEILLPWHKTSSDPSVRVDLDQSRNAALLRCLRGLMPFSAVLCAECDECGSGPTLRAWPIRRFHVRVRGRCGSEKNRCILKEAPSTRRPRQLPPPNHVDVQVEDGLPRARAVVHDDPVVVQAGRFRHGADLGHQVAQQADVLRLRLP